MPMLRYAFYSAIASKTNTDKSPDAARSLSVTATVQKEAAPTLLIANAVPDISLVMVSCFTPDAASAIAIVVSFASARLFSPFFLLYV